jgi:cytochrome bd ubiquinol oxidase subunit II
MPALWFWIVAAMLAAYVVLDGLDLGAGAIFLIAARTRGERRRILRAIGPAWDGNEVWLVAAAATLYFVFPQVYASVVSGFRGPLIAILCLLVLRAVGFEFRAHIENHVWQKVFEAVFSGASILLAGFLGAALGNLVRGVPLAESGYFSEPLWTNFKLSSDVGSLDWYTILIGVTALVTLAAHGSYYVALKTDGDLGRRARGFALICWPVQFFLTFTALLATYFIRPEIIRNYSLHKIGLIVPVAVVSSLAVVLWAGPRDKEKLAFIASSSYIVSMLAGVAFALYPVLLPARLHRYDLTIYNSSAALPGPGTGVAWLTLAAVLAIAYFVLVYRMFRGKVPAGEEQS